MKLYLLDSDILTYLEQQDSPLHTPVAQRLSQLDDSDEVLISIISFYEMQYGVSWADENERINLRRAIDALASRFQVVGLSCQGARIFGDLKAAYRRAVGITPSALKRNDIDLLIASTAIEVGAILVSNDHLFTTIGSIYPGFELENWAL